MILHAGLVARQVGGRWVGALIEGPSGCGKSDLALRLIEGGFRLVADDRVVAWIAQGRLYGRAPDTLHGLIEVRGLGVQDVSALPFAEIGLVVRPGEPERMPEPKDAERLSVRLPQITLAYREASAPAKLGRALGALYLGRERRM